MLEMEPVSCAAEKELCDWIEKFNDPALPEMDGVIDKFWYEGPNYKQIMETGSAELQELVFLVTNGVAPGGKEKERDAS